MITSPESSPAAIFLSSHNETKAVIQLLCPFNTKIGNIDKLYD